jgi:SAM-dependent methyltransferase
MQSRPAPAHSSLTCKICGCRLEPFQSGRSPRLESSTFKPTFHGGGAYGDLYRCPGCRTVHQSTLMRPEELHVLYRASSDDLYLAEERGRRRTARRLLDALRPRIPRGRLLEVGCGHGLLLDEARRRGYEVRGIELSADAACYARDELGLDVRETALEDAALQAAHSGERYDAILAVDVIEHLDDPLAALDCLCGLLTIGGVLLISIPDPSSFAARLSGKRWWGYKPAHIWLMPRETLREVVSARGLAPADEFVAKHSFTLAYWLRCLSQTSDGLWARMVAFVAAHLPPSLMLTASLGDEFVLLACRVAPDAPASTDAVTAAAVTH